MAVERTQLVIGRGQVFFGPFLPGTTVSNGEFYIGNTPAFGVSKSVETVDRMTAYGGQKIELEARIVRETHSINFITDNMSIENASFWYGGSITPLFQSRDASATDTLVVRKGLYYKLGVTPSNISGFRGVDFVHAFKASVEIPFDLNFEINGDSGLIRVLSDAVDIIDGDSIRFDFELRDVATSRIVSSKKELFGSVRFVSANLKGPNKHHFYPSVRLMASGSYDLKGNSWQDLSFAGEARKIGPLSEYVYIEEIRVGNTVDETSIIDGEGISLAEFCKLEDILNTIVNVELPNDLT